MMKKKGLDSKTGGLACPSHGVLFLEPTGQRCEPIASRKFAMAMTADFPR